MLYSDQSLDMLGVSDVQMESLVSASFADVNDGFANSQIGIEVTIVNQTRVRACTPATVPLTPVSRKTLLGMATTRYTVLEGRRSSAHIANASQHPRPP